MENTEQNYVEQVDYVDYVNNLIKNNPILIFSRNNCYPCTKAKMHLACYEPLNINLDEDPVKGNLIQNALTTITGQTKVPNIFLKSRHIGGCMNLEELMESGEFRAIIASIIFKDFADTDF